MCSSFVFCLFFSISGMGDNLQVIYTCAYSNSFSPDRFFPLMDKFRSSTIESDGLCRATPKAPHDPWAPKSSWSTRFCPPYWPGINQSWTLGSCWSWRPKLHLYTWDPLHRGNPYSDFLYGGGHQYHGTGSGKSWASHLLLHWGH